MRITVLGGTGYAGSNIVAEAAARGHEVTSWSRTAPAEAVAGVTYRTGSLTDSANLAAAVEGADVVVETIAPRGDMFGRVAPLVAELAQLAEAAGVRLGVVGGAGSLHVAEGGPRLLDLDTFPEAFLPEALELTQVLTDLQARDGSLDWFFVSPAAGFGGYAPGERTGHYRLGGDVLLADEAGNSAISGADFAIALVDELEKAGHSRRRFTVAY